jgi:hypothetical protein
LDMGRSAAFFLISELRAWGMAGLNVFPHEGSREKKRSSRSGMVRRGCRNAAFLRSSLHSRQAVDASERTREN